MFEHLTVNSYTINISNVDIMVLISFASAASSNLAITSTIVSDRTLTPEAHPGFTRRFLKLNAKVVVGNIHVDLQLCIQGGIK